MARARKKTQKKSSSGVVWFAGGLLLGLAGAAFLYLRGYMPSMPAQEAAQPTPSDMTEPELIQETEREKPRYDFFTVLPEMEVVVPERELEQPPVVGPDEDQTLSDSAEQFLLQAGSFRSEADADQMKARLALLGAVADIQSVTVNDETWHRVRVGPLTGARAADQLRRQLQNNGIDVLVLKANG